MYGFASVTILSSYVIRFLTGNHRIWFISVTRQFRHRYVCILNNKINAKKRTRFVSCQNGLAFSRHPLTFKNISANHNALEILLQFSFHFKCNENHWKRSRETYPVSIRRHWSPRKGNTTFRRFAWCVTNPSRSLDLTAPLATAPLAWKSWKRTWSTLHVRWSNWREDTEKKNKNRWNYLPYTLYLCKRISFLQRCRSTHFIYKYIQMNYSKQYSSNDCEFVSDSYPPTSSLRMGKLIFTVDNTKTERATILVHVLLDSFQLYVSYFIIHSKCLVLSRFTLKWCNRKVARN